MSAEINSPSSQENPEVIAALDLGSNSFHMVVAEVQRGQFKTIDRLREMVRLSKGMDATGEIDPEAETRAIACLERFGQRLRDMHANSVRAVGTNALRKAKNPKAFLKRAKKALGHPIEIISGIEEARLIYRGSTYSVSRPKERRLVLDIGGGSTELIIGEDMQAIHMESLFMGCVSTSERFFPDGALTEKRYRQAVLEVKLQLRPVIGEFKRLGWTWEIGTSGSIKSVMQILAELNDGGQSITLPELLEVRKIMLECEHVDKLNLRGLKKERAPVFPGGLAILEALFESLDIQEMTFSDGSLREGVLYDLMGRLHLEYEDTRVGTVMSLEQQYHIDFAQANRVELTVLLLLSKVVKQWQLSEPEQESFLRWAARLHEIGMTVAHSQYHRHGAYLLQHSDMPGFTWNEQTLLAVLVGCHRRKIRTDFLNIFVDPEDVFLHRMLVLVRLAVLMNRERIDEPPPLLELEAKDKNLHITFPKQWFDDRPLTYADLEQEKDYLKAIDFSLSFE